MSDLISRQAAIDVVEFGITYAKAIDVNTGESKELFKEGNDALKKAAERLKELPSAEPEIIRCRDCKYSQMTDDDECRYCKIWFAEEEHFLPGDYYCADAERRADERTD